MYRKRRSINYKIKSAPVNFPAPESINLTSSTESNCSITKTKKFNRYRNSPEDKIYYDRTDSTCSPVNYESHSDSSWSDDLENQSTEVIKHEYGLVEKLLFKEESFNIYNEEFDQWCDNFQHLRIIGTGIKCPHPSIVLKSEFTEEIIAEHKEDPEDTFLAIKEVKNQVKMAVIEKIIESVYSKRTSGERKLKSKLSTRSIPNKSNTPQKNIRPCKKKSFLPVRQKPLVGVTPVTSVLAKDPIMSSHINSAKWTKNDDYYQLKSVRYGSDYKSSTEQSASSRAKKVTFNTDNEHSSASKIDLDKHLNNARYIRAASPSSSCMNLLHLPPIDIHNKIIRPKSQNDKILSSSEYSTPRSLSKYSSEASNFSNFSPSMKPVAKSSNVSFIRVLQSPNYVQYL